jgi:hypothetical protein
MVATPSVQGGDLKPRAEEHVAPDHLEGLVGEVSLPSEIPEDFLEAAVGPGFLEAAVGPGDAVVAWDRPGDVRGLGAA